MRDLQSRGLTGEGWLTDSWYLAATSAELRRGRQLRRLILGEPVMLGRTAAGEVFALRDVCPHRLVPLSAGRQRETDGEPTIECPYHGWRFGTDGVCRLLPSLTEDDPFEAARVRVRRYPAHEANGAVFVYIADDPRATGSPDTPPPAFGALPGRPKIVLRQTLDLPMDVAAARLMTGASAPTRFHLPGYRWQAAQNGRARVLSLTCLTPQTATCTDLTQLIWWTGAPLRTLAIPILKQAAWRELQTLSLPGCSDKPEAGAAAYRTLKAEWLASPSRGA